MLAVPPQAPQSTAAIFALCTVVGLCPGTAAAPVAHSEGSSCHASTHIGCLLSSNKGPPVVTCVGRYVKRSAPDAWPLTETPALWYKASIRRRGNCNEEER